jgi:hypothetical protein
MYTVGQKMSASQKLPEQQANNTQPQPTQPPQTGSSQRQYQPKQYPRKQYYRKNYGQRYDNYQGDKNHARIVVSRDVYHKLVRFVLKYYGTLKGMSKITSELLDKAIDEAIADKENRKKYSQEMHLHSEV